MALDDLRWGELFAEFAARAEAVRSDPSHQQVLEGILELACRLIDGCDQAGVTLLHENGRFTTRASTDPLVNELDRLQDELAEGPCHDAARERHPFESADLAGDGRWPRFGAAAAALGMRRCLAIPLRVSPDGRNVAALNVFGRDAGPFSPESHHVAVALAAHLVVALVAVEEVRSRGEKIVNLEVALESRDVIGQAKGVLMERYRLSDEGAFEVLRRTSQHLNIKLRDVATELLETGQLPPSPASAPNSAPTSPPTSPPNPGSG